MTDQKTVFVVSKLYSEYLIDPRFIIISLKGYIYYVSYSSGFHYLSYGAGTIAADNRQPSELELQAAKAQGLDFGKIVKGSNFER